MYPADRHIYVDPEKLRPVPYSLHIPIGNGQESFVHAWHFPSQSAVKRKKMVVHFHGNGQNLTTHFLFFKWIIDSGYDYLIFDYRGYGQSSDDRATQEKTVQDGEGVFKYVYENFKNVEVIAIGQSLGSNVLVRTLQELNRKKQYQYLPKGVVLDSSFFSYKQAARSILKQGWLSYLLIPFTYIAISDEWSAKKALLETPKLPAIFFHGTKDHIIRFELGQESYNSWSGPKVFLEQSNGGHTSAFGEKRFSQNRKLLLNCINQVLESKEPFTDCVKSIQHDGLKEENFATKN